MLAAGGLAVGAKGLLAAVVAVPNRNSVSPPELAADAPVADILHPVEIVLIETLRNEADFTIFHSLNSGFRKLLHRHEPLF